MLSNTLYRAICKAHHIDFLREETLRPEDEVYHKLYSFSEEELRKELAICSQLQIPEGFALHPLPYSGELAYTTPRGAGHLTIVLNGRPGWSWYWDTEPGKTYYYRGGGCLFADALRDAEKELALGLDEKGAPRSFTSSV